MCDTPRELSPVCGVNRYKPKYPFLARDIVTFLVNVSMCDIQTERLKSGDVIRKKTLGLSIQITPKDTTAVLVHPCDSHACCKYWQQYGINFIIVLGVLQRFSF
jgi:hypothetical protein